MSRTRAFLLLMIVALWAAAPAFACLVPAQPHACCQHMMGDCEPMMGAEASCCQAHKPDTSSLPGRATATEHPMQMSPAQAVGDDLVPVQPATAFDHAAKGPRPPAPPGSSILRI